VTWREEIADKQSPGFSLAERTILKKELKKRGVSDALEKPLCGFNAENTQRLLLRQEG